MATNEREDPDVLGFDTLRRRVYKRRTFFTAISLRVPNSRSGPMWRIYRELGGQKVTEITEFFRPANEVVVAKNKLQVWAVKHCYTLVFLSFMAILAWLCLLTWAVVENYVK